MDTKQQLKEKQTDCQKQCKSTQRISQESSGLNMRGCTLKIIDPVMIWNVLKAADLKEAVEKFDLYLRHLVKYGDEDKIDVQEFRTEFLELLDDYQIRLHQEKL